MKIVINDIIYFRELNEHMLKNLMDPFLRLYKLYNLNN